MENIPGPFIQPVLKSKTHSHVVAKGEYRMIWYLWNRADVLEYEGNDETSCSAT